MTIFISIPVSGEDIQKQREHADHVKAALSRAGHKPVNPFEIFCGDNPSYKDHLQYGIRALMDCQAVYLCKGWMFSRGCRIEACVAKEFGLQIMKEDQNIKAQ